MDADQLVFRYLAGEASEQEIEELDKLLAKDPELRRKLIFEAANDAELRQIAMEKLAREEPPVARIISPRLQNLVGFALVASFTIFAGVMWLKAARTKIVAKISSVEDAAWQSSLPTELGSRLPPGYLKLTSGLATIRFKSGAEVTIEAPAKLMVKTPMRGKLISGAAVVDVPESATGFVLETPEGHVVDHGTRFAVHVSGENGTSEFEVIEGEISVHHPRTGKEVRLKGRQGASISEKSLIQFEGEKPEQPIARSVDVIRLGTNGRAATAIRHNKRKFLHPEMLMVNRTGKGTWDRYSFFEFDLASIDLNSVQSVKLRLNQVPSGIGFASRLPKMNQFSIYGLTNPAKQDWSLDADWESSPLPEDGVLLGSIEIPRSQQRGSIGFSTDELMNFISGKEGETVTFSIVRDTLKVAGQGQVLVHAFANDFHPEAAGPVLEFTLKGGD